MSKFRVELWRIFKFILITLAVEAVFSPLNSMLVGALMVNPDIPTGVWLAVFSWGFTIISTPVATLVHRYFTFRATVKWYIAVPVMLAATIVWQLLESFPMALVTPLGMKATLSMSYLLLVVWHILAYLLQRCVIYCHTTDTNGWYRRFHPDTNEEGV